MKQLELYINGEPDGFHVFMLRDGINPVRLDFTSQDALEMYREAVRLIEGDPVMSQHLRIFDPGRKVLKSGDTNLFFRLKSLKMACQLDEAVGERLKTL